MEVGILGAGFPLLSLKGCEAREGAASGSVTRLLRREAGGLSCRLPLGVQRCLLNGILCFALES